MHPPPSDELRFERWYPAAHRRMVAALALTCGQVDEAVEAVDEAFARLYERWDSVVANGDPSAWTYRVAVNVLRRRLRRRAMEAVVLRRARRHGDLAEAGNEIWHLIRPLSPRQRDVLILRYVADLTEAQVADALRISRSTVSSTLADAHRRLRPHLVDEREVDHARD